MSDEQTTFPSGWIEFGPHHWNRAWGSPNTAMVSLTIVNLVMLSFSLWNAFDVPVFVSIPFIALLVALTLLVVTRVVNRRWPLVQVNLDTSELRAGTTVVPLADVTRAVLGAWPTKNKTRMVKLRLTAGSVRTEVVVRDRDDRPLDTEQSRVLGEAISRTSIVMPTAKEDPTGRFARYNFPANIGREDAIDVVLHPPGAHDDLPIPG